VTPEIFKRLFNISYFDQIQIISCEWDSLPGPLLCLPNFLLISSSYLFFSLSFFLSSFVQENGAWLRFKRTDHLPIYADDAVLLNGSMNTKNKHARA
jgi:hypothetical protein